MLSFDIEDKVATATTVVINHFSGPRIMWALFTLVVGVVILMSYVLFYHWNMYGDNSRFLRTMRIVYISGTIVLLAVTAVCAYLYSII